MMNRILVLVWVALAAGCASYTTPGCAVSLAGIDDAGVEADQTAFDQAVGQIVGLFADIAARYGST